MTSLRVVADQRIVKKIVIFLYSFTLNGWTNFTGIKVRIERIIITIRLIKGIVLRIKKYN